MAYSYKRKISIDETKCGTADSTDFPLLFAGTYSWLATTANGGDVQNANGYDIAFFSDAALTTQLKHEVELYTAATGAVIYHVKIPTLSTSANTNIYIAYGDAGISTSQADAANVWDSNFKGVWHLPDGTTLSGLDSTANDHDLTATNTTAAAGTIGGAASFNGTTSELEGATSSGIGDATSMTISAWIRPAGWGESSAGRIFVADNNSTTVRNFLLVSDAAADENQTLKFASGFSTTGVWRSPELALSLNTWSHVAVTYTGSSTSDDPILYVNGAAVSVTEQTAPSGTRTASVGYVRLGNSSATDRTFNGRIDEVRFSNSIRSADWIAAEYNNQSSPGTFYSIIYIGSLAATLGAVTCEATGAFTDPEGESYTGTVDATLGAVTCAASGTFTAVGSCAATLGAVTCAADGKLTAVGTVVADLGAVTLAGAGSLTFAGTVAAAIGPIVASANGALSFTGALNAALSPVVAAAAGSLAFVGTIDVTLGAVLCTASGTHGSASYDGACAATVAPATCTASGALTFVGTCAATVGPVTMWSVQAGMAHHISVIPYDYRTAMIPADDRQRQIPYEYRRFMP